jgi:hypothetical protein
MRTLLINLTIDKFPRIGHADGQFTKLSIGQIAD